MSKQLLKIETEVATARAIAIGTEIKILMVKIRQVVLTPMAQTLLQITPQIPKAKIKATHNASSVAETTKSLKVKTATIKLTEIEIVAEVAYAAAEDEDDLTMMPKQQNQLVASVQKLVASSAN